MFMVVELKDNKIIWNDQKVVRTQREANARISVFQKQFKWKKFNIVKVEKYSLVA